MDKYIFNYNFIKELDTKEIYYFMGDKNVEVETFILSMFINEISNPNILCLSGFKNTSYFERLINEITNRSKYFHFERNLDKENLLINFKRKKEIDAKNIDYLYLNNLEMSDIEFLIKEYNYNIVYLNQFILISKHDTKNTLKELKRVAMNYNVIFILSDNRITDIENYNITGLYKFIKNNEINNTKIDEIKVTLNDGIKKEEKFTLYYNKEEIKFSEEKINNEELNALFIELDKIRHNNFIKNDDIYNLMSIGLDLMFDENMEEKDAKRAINLGIEFLDYSFEHIKKYGVIDKRNVGDIFYKAYDALINAYSLNAFTINKNDKYISEMYLEVNYEKLKGLLNFSRRFNDYTKLVYLYFVSTQYGGDEYSNDLIEYVYDSIDFDKIENKKMISEILLKFGDYLLKNKKYSKAYDLFNKSIEYDKDNPNAYFNLGFLYRLSGNTNENIKFNGEILEKIENLF